jgi:formylglycine-generating enzyme required for sulfatase activity
MIDVATSEVPRASSRSTKNGDDDLLDIINIIAEEMFGGGSTQSNSSGGKKNGDAYNPDGIDLVYVEGTGGTLGMQGFYIGKYEITQAQYQRMTGSNPSSNKAPNNPVENVSWNDVQEFLSKLNAMTGRNYRLPTEEEWVYAANGGLKNDIYEYPGSNNIHEVAWFDGNSGNQTHLVGTKSPNSIGIYDMSGNVWEWCQDYYDSSGSRRVSCGGSYVSGADRCRVASRISISPGFHDAILGFRVVLP